MVNSDLSEFRSMVSNFRAKHHNMTLRFAELFKKMESLQLLEASELPDVVLSLAELDSGDFRELKRLALLYDKAREECLSSSESINELEISQKIAKFLLQWATSTKISEFPPVNQREIILRGVTTYGEDKYCLINDVIYEVGKDISEKQFSDYVNSIKKRESEIDDSESGGKDERDD